MSTVDRGRGRPPSSARPGTSRPCWARGRSGATGAPRRDFAIPRGTFCKGWRICSPNGSAPTVSQTIGSAWFMPICVFSWFFYDFAAAVSFMEHEPIVAELQNAWLEGYRRITPVSEADEAMLPVFVMLRRMLLTAWIASHSDAETARRLGTEYTEGTVAMGERFLRGV